MNATNAIHVLVVDDEANIRATLADILADEGYQVDTADTGELAIERCAQRRYDVILMDVRMPGLSGVEAFRRIRQTQRGVRVILMSAYGVNDLKQAALDDGAIAFLDKPLDLDKLLRLVGEALETAVLVVEDNASDAATLSQRLREHNYHVTVVRSAPDALHLVEQICFDVILIDIHLPAMNGLDLYLAIKQITPTAVAIMITGADDESEQLAREAVRRTAYTMIHKPIDLDELLKMLDRIKRQRVSDLSHKP